MTDRDQKVADYQADQLSDARVLIARLVGCKQSEKRWAEDYGIGIWTPSDEQLLADAKAFLDLPYFPDSE